MDAATQQGVSLDEEAELQAEALLWAQEAWRVVEEATAGQASAETQGQEAEARIGGLGLAAVAGKKKKISGGGVQACLFECLLCGVRYSDSSSYTSHLNTREHQRRSGRSLVARPIDANQLRHKLNDAQEPLDAQPLSFVDDHMHPNDPLEECRPSELEEELGFASFGSSKAQPKQSKAKRPRRD